VSGTGFHAVVFASLVIFESFVMIAKSSGMCLDCLQMQAVDCELSNSQP
jgi:hypothetical protein